MIAALVLSFMVCFVYEQYEDKIDEIAEVVLSIAWNATLFFCRKVGIAKSRKGEVLEKGSNEHAMSSRQ